MRVIAEAESPAVERAEDVWVSHVLHEHGIPLENLFPAYVCYENNWDTPHGAFEVAMGLGKDERFFFPSHEANTARFLLIYRRGDLQEALRSALYAVAKEPTNVIAWNNLGLVRSDLGDYETAVLALEAALRFDPSYERAKNNLIEAKGRWRESRMNGAPP